MAFLKELLKHSHNNNLTASLIGMKKTPSFRSGVQDLEFNVQFLITFSFISMYAPQSKTFSFLYIFALLSTDLLVLKDINHKTTESSDSKNGRHTSDMDNGSKR